LKQRRPESEEARVRQREKGGSGDLVGGGKEVRRGSIKTRRKEERRKGLHPKPSRKDPSREGTPSKRNRKPRKWIAGGNSGNRCLWQIRKNNCSIPLLRRTEGKKNLGNSLSF